MRRYKDFWFYQGSVYPTLRAALLAARLAGVAR